jgi:hypothetical protein
MSRGTVRLLVAAGALIVLVLVFANPFRDTLRSRTTDWAELYADVDLSRADRIRVKTMTDSTLLVREGASWTVASQGGFPADTAAVGNLLRAVKNARSTGIASTNPENQSRFQVDRTGVEVEVQEGEKTLAHFTVGKMGQDFTTSYVLPAGSDEVHVVRGMNRNLFARPQGMRDRTLLAFDPAAARAVRHEAASGGWELSRSDTTWMVQAAGDPSSHPAQVSVANEVVQTLSTLSADGFFEGSPDTLDSGLGSPEHRFTVRLADGSESSVAIGKKDDRGQYYAVRSDRPTIYLLAEWRVTGLAKPVSELTGSGGP